LKTFNDLELITPLLRALQAEGYSEPTPVQQKAIPHVIAGRDLLGCAQTGTGKTAAFALPVLQRLDASARKPQPRGCRALVLTPTRELAIQVEERFRAYGRHLRLKSAVIFGGVGQGPQVQVLAAGLDVLVATPGRLLDLVGQGHARLDGVEVFVLDEADRMLDMGFIHDVRRVIEKLPKQRQTLFFSATMPPPIVELAGRILTSPARVDVSPDQPAVERIDQQVVHTAKAEKPALLRALLQDASIERAIVFTRTKHGANKVVKQLASTIEALAIHGNKSQNARQQALESFRTGRVRVLIATDIAARGIDVDGISHVFNYDLPDVPESYVHRIGRTARAGASGRAISFCDAEERDNLRAIERLLAKRIPVTAAPANLPREPAPSPEPQRRPERPRPAQARPAPLAAPSEVGVVMWHQSASGAKRPATGAARPAAAQGGNRHHPAAPQRTAPHAGTAHATPAAAAGGEGRHSRRRRRRRQDGGGSGPRP
jgi:ATP-dependent RNA helicase RhlE